MHREARALVDAELAFVPEEAEELRAAEVHAAARHLGRAEEVACGCGAVDCLLDICLGNDLKLGISRISATAWPSAWA